MMADGSKGLSLSVAPTLYIEDSLRSHEPPVATSMLQTVNSVREHTPAQIKRTAAPRAVLLSTKALSILNSRVGFWGVAGATMLRCTCILDLSVGNPGQ